MTHPIPEKKSRRRWPVYAVQAVIIGLVLWFVHRTLAAGLAELATMSWQLRPGWLILAGVLTLLGYLPCGLYWHQILRAMGQQATLAETLRAYYVGQIGKYVPGKVMVIVIRTGLIRSYHVHTTVAAVSVFLETLTMMAVGGFIAAAILAILFRGHAFLFVIGLGFMLLVGLPTFPPVLRRILPFLKVGRADPKALEKVHGLGYGTLAIGWVAMAFSWLFTGLGLWAVMEGIGVTGMEPVDHAAYFVGSVAVSKTAGFISLIPAGLGVGDMTLTQLMTNYCNEVLALPKPEAIACLAAVVLRLVWLASDAVVAVVLYFAGPHVIKRFAKNPPPAPQDLS